MTSADNEGLQGKKKRWKLRVSASVLKGQDEAAEKADKLTGLGIASGSILCLDFCTAGMSDACFTFKICPENCAKQDNIHKYKE